MFARRLSAVLDVQDDNVALLNFVEQLTISHNLRAGKMFWRNVYRTPGLASAAFPLDLLMICGLYCRGQP